VRHGYIGHMVPRFEPAPVHPLSTIDSRPTVLSVLTEGPAVCLLASGDLDDGSWGVVGAFWLSDDSERGGFVVSPEALWTGSEMARSYRHAVDRGWSPGAVFAYWETQIGVTGNLMLDPPQHVDSLLHIHRRVGAL
jgi:hypothetical protein